MNASIHNSCTLRDCTLPPLVNCFWVQCCSEKESWLVLWLLRNNSPLCRQLPVLPWVKSPALSPPSSGMGSSDKLGALTGITPCCCVSHEFPNIPPGLCGVSLGLVIPSKNCCLSPFPCFTPDSHRSPSQPGNHCYRRFLKLSSERVKNQQ